jgi:hypothetical protein
VIAGKIFPLVGLCDPFFVLGQQVVMEWNERAGLGVDESLDYVRGCGRRYRATGEGSARIGPSIAETQASRQPAPHLPWPADGVGLSAAGAGMRLMTKATMANPHDRGRGRLP